MSICHVTLVKRWDYSKYVKKVNQIIKNLSKKSCIKIKKHCKKINKYCKYCSSCRGSLLKSSDVRIALTVLMYKKSAQSPKNHGKTFQ